MFNKNWWFLNFHEEFLNFSFYIRKLAVAFYMINEIQPKIKFQNIVQCPFKWPRYFYSRWCPRGGFHGTPPEKTTFPPEFCNEICTIYVRAIKNHNSAKKISKCCSVSKWRPNNRFLFRVISILAKFWKTTFPKEFFNEIWLQEGEYE